MYYPDELVDEVARSNDIVDIIGNYVKLKRQGNRYTGLCPFHNEKTPSFSVGADSQLYYCFGCHAGGNVFTFVMEYENYSFQEAIEYLADRANITLPTVDQGADRARDSRKKRMLEANKKAATYFYYQLKRPQGEKAYNYLKGRGLSDETIRNFGLGYSNITSNDLYLYLKKEGYEDKLLADCGLIKVDEKGAHDRFWNRVMFPIMDANNRVIGFGGRVMGEGLPKYLNSPETTLFDKSRNLYGLHAAKKARKDYFLLCEGYMDVIALHQAGFNNAVASLGTAFTPQHAILMKRYVDHVVLTFDSDGAGVNAALRAIPILKRAGLSVKVLNMRPHKDPDEFIKAEGAQAYQERINQAKNGFMFEISVLRSQFDFRDPEQKTKFQMETARKLLEFEEEMERSNYIEAVALEYDMNGAELRRKVNQLGVGLLPGETPGSVAEDVEKQRQQARIRKADTSDKQAQRMLMAWMASYPQAFPQLREVIGPQDFLDGSYRTLAQMIFKDLEQDKKPNPAELINHFMMQAEEDENGDAQKEYKMISQIFHTGVGEDFGLEEKQRIFADLVRKVKSDSIRQASRDVSDIKEFQKMVDMQNRLKTFRIDLR